MLKTFERESNCCQKGFFKEINAVFIDEKSDRNLMPQNQTEVEKNHKDQILKVFSQFLSNFRKPGSLEC